MENLTGKFVDRYQILELLGQGGMAMVYKAYDPRLEREVALKIIRLDVFPPNDLQDVRKRFEREAKALAQLSHPNIIKVMDYGEYEGLPFLVMEYLQGGTLKQMIGEPMSWQEAMRLVLPIARGLEYAHRRGIVHRDIKPANILMTEDGDPMLSDFGIVKLLQGRETTTLTASGAAIGTPEYMAPEQWTGKTSLKSDMYSLGVVLYEIITGRRPYDADTPGELFLKQVTEPMPLPKEIIRDLPEPVEQFLLKTLDKEPSERHNDFGIFIREIENLLTEKSSQTLSVELETSKPVKVSKTDTNRKIPNRRCGSVVVIVIISIGIIIGGVFGLPLLLSQSQNAPEPTKTIATPTRSSSIVPTLRDQNTPIEPNSTPTRTPFFVPTLREQNTPTVTNLPTEITDDFGIEMALVPAGEFTMGNEDGEDDEKPVHTVYLDAYYIDKYEITNAYYQTCVIAGVCKLPKKTGSSQVNNYYGNPQYDNYPVLYVDWNMAETYCEWRQAGLPTEAQWEKAARGTDGRLFPWGFEPKGCPVANYQTCFGNPTEVGIFPEGVSPYGLFDMAGNVSEWVWDWYDPEYYIESPLNNPKGPSTGDYRVMRGGSWSQYSISARVSYRYRGNQDGSNNTIGFRCARDATP